MKIYGYVRDKDGNFDKRKNKAVDFSKQMNFEIDEFIFEKSSGDYETMIRAKSLLEKEKDFILVVSDSSDLFEDCEEEPLPFSCEEYAECLETKLEELRDRHQQDCITINQLHTTIDTLVDRYAKLREMRGL